MNRARSIEFFVDIRRISAAAHGRGTIRCCRLGFLSNQWCLWDIACCRA